MLSLSILSQQILVECLDFAFIAYIKYEQLPLFCLFCKLIGHELSSYKSCKQEEHNDKYLKIKQQFVSKVSANNREGDKS